MSNNGTVTTPLTVLIIGCGNIAGRFDFERRALPPLSHAGVLCQDDRFRIVACVEPNEFELNRFKKFFNIEHGFRFLADVVHAGLIFDVIVVCSPTSQHYSDLNIALGLKPKLIFCEKPVTQLLIETNDVLKKGNQFNIPIVVNYSRRWDESVEKFVSDALAKKFGKLRFVNINYSRGVLNNGSHAIDLLSRILGELNIEYVGNPIWDGDSLDPTVDAVLLCNDGVRVFMHGATSNDFSIFEMHFHFSNSIVSMEDGGLVWSVRVLQDSLVHKGYQILGRGSESRGLYAEAMKNAYDNIFRHIVLGDSLLSTIESALPTQELCNRLIIEAIHNS